MTQQATVIDTPDGIAAFHMFQLRAMLRLEITTGLKHSRGSVMKQVNKEYGTKFRTKKAAFEFIDNKIREMGL